MLTDAVRHLLELGDESARRRWIERCIALFPADDLLPFLVTESERLINADPYGKLRIAETLVIASVLTMRTDFQALGMLAKADAFRVLGRYQESVEAADASGRLFLSIGDEMGWARTRIPWIWSSHNLGHGESALGQVGRAHDILMKHQNPFKAAALDLHTGWVCFELGRYDEAFSHYNRARELYESLGSFAEAQLALVKMDTAILLTQLGDFQAALRLHEETLQVYLRHGETVSVLRQEHYVAFVYATQGHYTRALHHYNSVLTAYESSGLDNDAALVALRMVECYLRLNRPTEALELAEETARRFERLGTPTDGAKAHFYSAIATARLGDIEGALGILDMVAATFASTGLLTERALVTLQRATLYLDNENWFAARDEAEHAGILLAERGLVMRRAQADIIRARASLALGENEIAETLARSVLRVSHNLDVLWLAYEAHHILGDVAQARADPQTALKSYDQAVRSIERMQSSLAIELRTNFLEDKLRVYEEAIATSLRLAHPETAFAYLERAKSRALVAYLAGNLEIQIRARDSANQDLVDTLTRLREEHNGLYNRLYGYGFSQDDERGVLRTDDDALRSAIRDREKQIARVLERLALDRTEGLVLGGPDDMEDQRMPQLDEGTVLLEYFFRDDGGVAFVITSRGLNVVPLSARPDRIRRLLHQWNLNLGATARAVASDAPIESLGRNARGILASLYHSLIAPVTDHLAGYERVIIVPYGPTHAVPFHALFDGERYLLESVEVSVAPSSDVLRLCIERLRHTEQRMLVVANTDGGRLPAVLREARAVAALVPGECYTEERATRAAVIAAAPDHSIIHLAAHGEARVDNPTFAHLKLADGQLGVVDIFNLQLCGALVTLSACETGQSVVAGGDELIGLSRGFLYAGASTLVQSLWRVEDGSTATLMECFYRELRDGAPKGAALRTAQRALLDANGEHPFYWAPFQLIGDSGLS